MHLATDFKVLDLPPSQRHEEKNMTAALLEGRVFHCQPNQGAGGVIVA